MLNWTAIVPLKGGAARKTRLAERLSAPERLALSNGMAGHVLATLCAAGLRPCLLSPEAWGDAEWVPDRGAGLNAELDRVRAVLGATPLLVIHADLPHLTREDVRALLAAAEARGAAIAPDRAETGTNAIALHRGCPLAFAFGTDSFARHRTALPDATIVRRAGLALDIDTPDDLDLAGREGVLDQAR